MAAISSYRKVWFLPLLISFTGLFIGLSHGICSTVPNCDVCTDPNICTSCNSTYGLTSSQPPTCQLCSTNSGCSFCTRLSLCNVCADITIGPDKNGLGTCSSCSSNCQYCAVNGAGTCDANSCVVGYGLELNNTCTACSEPNCQSCFYNSALKAMLCNSCKVGYFWNSTVVPYVCTRCSSNCLSCYGPAPNNCNDCIQGYGFVPTTSVSFCAPCRISFCQTCLYYYNTTCSQCQAGYQFDYTTQTCKSSAALISTGSCNTIANCDVCVDPNICTSCSLTYGLTSSQPPTCQLCSTNYGCSFCSKMSLCDVCTDISTAPDRNGVGTCSSCAPNCQLCLVNGAGRCDTNECSIGYGLNIINLCTACSIANCATCIFSGILNQDQCSSCKPGYLLNYTLTPSTCSPCNLLNCDMCSAGPPASCSICRDGYYRNITSYPYLCAPCTFPCKTCYGATSSNCYQCQTGFSTVNGNGNTCAQCHVNFCKSCSVDQNTCIQCISGYYLNTTSLLCTPCTALNCDMCATGNPASCNTCIAGYYRNYNGTYFCARCASNCRTCFDAKPYSCYDCIPGYSFIPGTQFCALTGAHSSVSSTTSRPTSPTTRPGISSNRTDSNSSNGISSNQQASAQSSSDSLMIATIVLAILLGVALLGCVVLVIVMLRERMKKGKQEQTSSAPQTAPTPNNNYIQSPENRIQPPSVRSPKYQTLDFSRGIPNNNQEDAGLYELPMEDINNRRTS